MIPITHIFRTEHYNNLHKLEDEKYNNNNGATNNGETDPKITLASPKPLKDQSNIRAVVSHNRSEQNVSSEKEISPRNNTSAFSSSGYSESASFEGHEGERPLKCLETLAEKAGISLDDKYEGNNTLFNLEKSQSPAQAHAPSQVPLQISQEQLAQLQQQFQFQQAIAGIQVKQEFPNQQQNSHMTGELKPQILDVQQQHIQQMQVVEGQPQSPHHPPSSVSGINTHGTTTINTLSPLQAMQAGQISTDWQQSRLQVLPQTIQNTPYLQQVYSQPLVMSSNILHPGLSGQQQIQ